MTLDLPRSALAAFRVETEADAGTELRLAAAVKLFELGRLSSGAAAELAGLHRMAFLDRLKDFDVAAVELTAEDLRHDVAVLQSRGF